METQATYPEALTLVFREYDQCLDLEVALAVVNTTDEIRDQLRADPDLIAMIKVRDAREKASIYKRYKEVAETSPKPSTKLAALQKLAEAFYPERFNKGASASKVRLASVKRLEKIKGEWPDDYKEKAEADLQSYIDEVDFPTEAEYCYTRGITLAKMKKYLAEGIELMAAKRNATLIKRGWEGDEQLGTFLTRLSANADEFSLVDKAELTGKNGEPVQVTVIKRIIVDGAAERV